MAGSGGRAALDRVAERRVEIDGFVTNYGEGPDNGPPLVLVHGQGSQWEDHAKVLPDLVQRYHVYAVDVAGHGQSGRLGAQDYTNANVGALLAAFLDEVVREPAIVSGHSSGALLALWLAANRPELVRGLLLEDPPLFSSIPPRAERTTGGMLPRLAVEYLRARPAESFQRYYVEHSEYFAFFGPLARGIARYSLRWIDNNPGRPLRIFFLPWLVNVYFEGFVNYDPVFGTAFDSGHWYDGFDTAAALAAVEAPTTLIHTNWWFKRNGTYYDERNVLMAAMDGEDKDRAMELLRDPELVEIACGHLVHVERAKEYLAALGALSERVGVSGRS